mmetsp:Transcript_39748/g.124869  ORF Transcript_39748/g.124869 Transcript_39748/m.124869 type:complete len:218 (-) Transcript_39748:102-755(-)
MRVADGGLVVDCGCDDSDVGEARGSQQHAHVERLGVDETAHPEEEVVIHEVLEDLCAQGVSQELRSVLVVGGVQVDHKKLELSLCRVHRLPKASRLSCWMHISMLQVESVDEFLSLGLDPPLSHVPVPSPEDRRKEAQESSPRLASASHLFPSPSFRRCLDTLGRVSLILMRSKSCLDRVVEIPAMNLQAVDTLLNVLPACDLLEGRDHPIPVEPHR